MNERGSVSVWMMGVAGLLVLLGGLLVDVWRLVDAREHLAARADSWAVAIASNIDVDGWRRDGTLRVDRRGCDVLEDPLVVVCVAEGDTVAVELIDHVPLTLTGVIHPDPVEIRATATARAFRR
jgi:hypothetical protein